ncbi:hypothetical protein [Silvanigrella aquatica]|uniref:Uncharacterized protein n=1 Tax=Silvanigrella aquatica TaxID=1915309 RepID=A0A1L4CY15_9BACT|nr:hypothetical protein [Silvanigrella aquatica]APJ02834.1 hypothetical protein AXG55_02420 [Silvanigrella aquatica]
MLIFIVGFFCAFLLLGVIGIFYQNNDQEKKESKEGEVHKKNEANPDLPIQNKKSVCEYDQIQSKFAIIRADWTKDLTEIKNALNELSQLCDEKNKIVKNLKDNLNQVYLNMEESIHEYKKTKAEIYQEKYTNLAIEKDKIIAKIHDIESDLSEQNNLICSYYEKKDQLQKNLEHLKYQEQETILNIKSLKKIEYLEAKIAAANEQKIECLDFANDSSHKIKASLNSIQTQEQSLEDELLQYGLNKKYKENFNMNVKMEELWEENKSSDVENSQNKIQNENLKIKKQDSSTINNLFS